MEPGGDLRQSIERRRPKSLVFEVREELERLILTGALRGGERLNESELAAQMGVSRGPVREAARSLEKEGLVRTVAHQGVYVRDLTIEEALELYDLRAMMAGYLCARLADRADAAVMGELHGFLDAMDAAAAAHDEARYFELNLAFHDRIAEAAGPGRAQSLYTSLGKEVRLMRLRVLTGLPALQVSNAEHRRIVEAIGAGDTGRAYAEGAQHHMNGKKRLQDTLDGGGRDRSGGPAPGGPEQGPRRAAE